MSFSLNKTMIFDPKTVSGCALLVLITLMFGLIGLILGLIAYYLIAKYDVIWLKKLPTFIKNLIKLSFDFLVIVAFGSLGPAALNLVLLFGLVFFLISVGIKIYWEPIQFLSNSLIIKICCASILSTLLIFFVVSAELYIEVTNVNYGALITLGLSPLMIRALLLGLIQDLNQSIIESRNAVLLFSEQETNYLQNYAGLLREAGYNLRAFVGDDSSSSIGRGINNIPVIAAHQLSEYFPGTDEPKTAFLIRNSIDVESNKTKKIMLEASGYIVRQIPSARQNIVEDALGEQDLPITLERLLKSDSFSEEDDVSKEQIDTVLVTGGAGSIGTELVNGLLGYYNLKNLIVVDNSEHNLFVLGSARLNEKQYAENVAIKFADICNYAQLEAVFKEYKPTVVLHAAAMKHVPIVEENILSAHDVNIGGTKNVLKLVKEYDVKKFCLISTDKAVEPSSAMGLTKRVCELLVEKSAQDNASREYSIVRFGNVIASSGSVLPIFADQIKRGKEVTITHPDMTRYFMTIKEAAHLVLKATLEAKKELGAANLFILDMGKSHKIIDLVKTIAAYSGKKLVDTAKGENEITIRYTGIRPGEKVEEKLTRGEKLIDTELKRVKKMDSQPFAEQLQGFSEEISGLSEELQNLGMEWVAEL